MAAALCRPRLSVGTALDAALPSTAAASPSLFTLPLAKCLCRAAPCVSLANENEDSDDDKDEDEDDDDDDDDDDDSDGAFDSSSCAGAGNRPRTDPENIRRPAAGTAIFADKLAPLCECRCECELRSLAAIESTDRRLLCSSHVAAATVVAAAISGKDVFWRAAGWVLFII